MTLYPGSALYPGPGVYPTAPTDPSSPTTSQPTVAPPKRVISSDPLRSGGFSLWYSVDAYRGGSLVAGASDLRPSGGSITDTTKPGVRRTLSLELPRTLGLYDLLAPSGTTLKVTGHIRDIGRQTTDIPMGVFDVNDQALDEGAGKLTLTAPDLWQRIVRAKFVGPQASIPGLSVAQQIAFLIQGALGASTQVTLAASSTAVMGAQVWEKDRAQAIIDLATSIGAWVYADRSGQWIVADVPMMGAAADWLIDSNPAGVLVELTRQRSRASTYNVVCVEPQSSSSPTFSTTWVWDSDPNSVTYANPAPVPGPGATSPPNPALAGPFGLSVYYYDTALPLDPGQAAVLGYSILAKTTGLSSQVSLSSGLNPYIDAGQVLNVLGPRERYDMARTMEKHIADTVTHPLTMEPGAVTHIDGRSTRTDPYT